MIEKKPVGHILVSRLSCETARTCNAYKRRICGLGYSIKGKRCGVFDTTAKHVNIWIGNLPYDYWFEGE